MTPDKRSLAENILAGTGYLASTFILLLLIYGIYEVATDAGHTMTAMLGDLLTGGAAIVFYPLLIVATGSFWLRSRLSRSAQS